MITRREMMKAMGGSAALTAQLFAAHLASIKGLNADSPRTLTKITRTM